MAVTATQLGLQPSQAHYDAEGEFERMAGRGEITGSQADYLKGRNLIETGFNPVLAAAGAVPYQLFDEAFDPQSEGNRSLSNALSQGWQNLRGVGSVVGERIQENPWGFLSAIFSSQKTPETWVDHRFDEPSASDIEAFGDPKETISRSIGEMLMNPMGGMVNVVPGVTYQSVPAWGRQHYQDFGRAEGRVLPAGGYGSYVQSYPDLAEVYEAQREGMGGAGQLAPWEGPNKLLRKIPGTGELERQRNMLDVLVAGGDLTAPAGYRSSVPYEGNVPGHAFGADMYGYQAGLKRALAEQFPVGGALYNISNLRGTPGILGEIKESEAERALRGYRAGQGGGYRGAALRMMPEAFAETLTAPGSTYDPALGGMSPVPDIPGITEMEGTLDEALREGAISRGLEGAQMDFREPRIPFSLPVMLRGTRDPADTRKYLLNRQFGTGTDYRAPMVDTFAPPEPPYMVPVTNTEAMASEVQRALDRAGRIGPTPPVTSIESQLQALTELAQTDPTIAARYTTPGSQDLIDIATQVDSFAGMPTPSVPLPPQLARPAPTPEPTPEPARVKRSKKVKKAKTQAQTTKARRRKKVKDVKVKSVAKTSKVTKSAASQALSRARGNVKDANTIAKITKSFTAAKKKDPKVYMPTIRRAPSGAWVGGF